VGLQRKEQTDETLQCQCGCLLRSVSQWKCLSAWGEDECSHLSLDRRVCMFVWERDFYREMWTIVYGSP